MSRSTIIALILACLLVIAVNWGRSVSNGGNLSISEYLVGHKWGLAR